MSFPHSLNPFLSHDSDPDTPPIPPRSPERLARPRSNPFHDPVPPDQVYAKPMSNNNNNSYRNAAYMSGANNEDSESAKQPSSETSRSAGSTLGTKSTIDRSYVYPFASAGVNDAGGSYVVENPFADPMLPAPMFTDEYTNTTTARMSKTPSTPLRNIRPSLKGTLSQIQKVNTKFRLSPIKESPPPTTTLNRFSTGLKRFSGGRTPTRNREEKLLKTALHQSHLLETERKKNASLYPEASRLYPSPRTSPHLGVRRGLGERDVSSSSTHGLVIDSVHDIENGNETTGNRRRAIRSPAFWIFFCLIQVGLVSTGAAFAVLLRNKTHGERVHASAGMVLWLIISLLAILTGIIGALCIWGMGRERFSDFMSRIGLGELGLMPSTKGENRVQRSFREREEEARRMRERLDRVRERERERDKNVGRTNTMSSIRTINPEWQALYATPEELRREPRWGRDAVESALEMEILAGKEVLKKKKCIVVETLLSGGTPLMEFDECDVGMQVLSPRRMPDEGKTTTANGDHRFPFSKFKGRKVVSDEHFTPQHLRGRKSLATTNANNKISTPPESNRPNGTLDREVSKHLSKDFRVAPPPPVLNASSTSPTNNNIDEEIEQSGICHSPTVALYTALASWSTSPTQPNLHLQQSNPDETPLTAFSPLENLARELNTPELRSLSAEQRVDYFVERRSLNEERGRKVRESLERGGSFSGSRRSSVLCEEVREEDESCTSKWEGGDSEGGDNKSMSGEIEEMGLSAGEDTPTSTHTVMITPGLEIPGAFLTETEPLFPAPNDINTPIASEKKKCTISLIQRKLKPMILERVRDLEERDSGLKSASTTSLGSESEWIGRS